MKNMTGSLAGTIGNVNPIRYRSYFYDSEINMYYLNSRYYSPDLCRFLNADSVVSGVGQDIMGYNMFAYCGNNPVNYSDSTGTMREWVLDGITYVYNGTASDFHRLEQGLSPISYERALEKKNAKSVTSKVENKPNMVPRKDKKKGSDNRQKGGDRERNVGHPNGEEHSRVAKGTNTRRFIALSAFVVTSVVIIVMVADDATGVGVANDVLLAPTSVIWWDMASKVFA